MRLSDYGLRAELFENNQIISVRLTKEFYKQIEEYKPVRDIGVIYHGIFITWLKPFGWYGDRHLLSSIPGSVLIEPGDYDEFISHVFKHIRNTIPSYRS